MTRDIYEAAEALDSDPHARTLRMIAREARRHGHTARVVRDHVLVVGADGSALATRSARRLAAWLGY